MASHPTATRRPTLLLLTGLTALLAACGGTGTPAPTPPKPNPTPTEVAGLILGKLTPYKAGDASSVKQSELNLSAPVNSMGNFDMALPKVAEMASKNAGIPVPAVFGDCTPATAGVPAELLVYPINFLTTDKGQRFVSEPTAGKTPLTFRAWWFSNMDATVTYKGNCFPLGDIDTSFKLKRGWNLLITATDGNTTTYTASTQPTTHVAWQPYSAPTINGLSLHPDILTPWKTLPQYRDR